MVQKFFRLAPCWLFLLGLAGCQPKHRPVEGTVFIVKQNAENAKLGLVDVLFLETEAARTVAASAEKTAKDTLTNLQAQIETRQKKIAELEEEQKKQKAAWQGLEEQLKAARARLPDSESSLARPTTEMAAIRNDLDAIQREIEYWTKEVPARLADLRARLAFLNQRRFEENSKMRTTRESAPDFPEIPELESEIRQLSVEKTRKLTELTERQKMRMESLARLEDRNRDKDLAFQKARQKQQDEVGKEIASIQERMEENSDRLMTLDKDLAQQQKSLRELTARLGNLNQEFETSLFAGLPAPVLKAKTDADGNFRVLLPYRGSFCVAARGDRNVTSDLVEKYSWLFVIPPRDEEQDKLFGLCFTPFGKPSPDRVLLSNDNQIRSGFQDSLATYPLKP